MKASKVALGASPSSVVEKHKAWATTRPNPITWWKKVASSVTLFSDPDVRKSVDFTYVTQDSTTFILAG